MVVALLTQMVIAVRGGYPTQPTAQSLEFQRLLRDVMDSSDQEQIADVITQLAFIAAGALVGWELGQSLATAEERLRIIGMNFANSDGLEGEG